MRIKIKSDGTALGTHVYDADTNKELRLVQNVTVSISANDTTKVMMTLMDADLELHTKVFEEVRPEAMIPEGWEKVTGGWAVNGTKQWINGTWEEIPAMGNPVEMYECVIRKVVCENH